MVILLIKGILFPLTLLSISKDPRSLMPAIDTTYLLEPLYGEQIQYISLLYWFLFCVLLYLRDTCPLTLLRCSLSRSVGCSPTLTLLSTCSLNFLLLKLDPP